MVSIRPSPLLPGWHMALYLHQMITIRTSPFLPGCHLDLSLHWVIGIRPTPLLLGQHLAVYQVVSIRPPSFLSVYYLAFCLNLQWLPLDPLSLWCAFGQLPAPGGQH